MRRATLLLVLAMFPFMTFAQDDGAATRAAPTEEPAAATFDPYFLGWGSEPTMDSGGRVIASMTRAIDRAFARLAPEKPAVAPAWEFPVGILLSVVHHEFDGHGGRAREFDLGPSYGFGFDLSAYTSIDRAPRSHVEGLLLAAGGTESDTVLAHRLQLDLLRPEGAEAWTVPLLLAAKLDLARYIEGTDGPDRPRPGEDDDLLRQYRDGNDIASWMVGRHALRTGQDVAAVWNGDATIDYDDPLIDEDWDAVRVAAVWSLLDPALVGSAIDYFRHHVIGGQTRVRTPGLDLAEGWRLTAGTRAALGPGEVTRFLDVYLGMPNGVLRAYVRDLDSAIERTWGGGVGLHGFRLGPVELGVSGDWWRNPAGPGFVREDSGWNASATADVRFGRYVGLSLAGGHKEGGFLPGAPMDDGGYVSAGLLLWLDPR